MSVDLESSPPHHCASEEAANDDAAAGHAEMAFIELQVSMCK
jgi:hypothetical protein